MLLLAGCATIGSEGQGDLNLPSSGAGPFRKLDGTEVAGVAPFVLDDRTANYRDPAVILAGTDAILYSVAKVGGVNGKDAIVRSRATDQRSFFGTSTDLGHTPATVLEADLPWEAGIVKNPFVAEVGGSFLLYYAGGGGIGLARGADGFAFVKEKDPILVFDPTSRWEEAIPSAPTAYVGVDGKTHLFYDGGGSIGEAVSDDGIHFTRAGDTPVLIATVEPSPASLLPNEKPPFDTARVGDPCVSAHMTPAGREQVRLFYTGARPEGTTAIGFAARYGDSGPFDRNPLPVYANNQKEQAPAYLDGPGYQYLYVQAERKADNNLVYPAIAAAFAPGNVHLPPPAPFPDTP
jgi:hypothetical protein